MSSGGESLAAEAVKKLESLIRSSRATKIGRSWRAITTMTKHVGLKWEVRDAGVRRRLAYSDRQGDGGVGLLGGFLGYKACEGSPYAFSSSTGPERVPDAGAVWHAEIGQAG